MCATHGKRWRLDAEEDGDSAAGEIGNSQIGAAIAIEVADCDGLGAGSGWIRRLRLERAIAAPRQDGNRIAPVISGDQIEFPVAIHISNRDALQ